MWEASGKELLSSTGKIVRDEGIARETEGGGKLFALIDDNQIPLGSFVKIKYPLNTFFSVAKIPESALYKDNIIFLEDKGISKKIMVEVIYKDQGFVLINGKSIKDKNIIVNRFSFNIDGRKINVFDK